MDSDRDVRSGSSGGTKKESRRFLDFALFARMANFCFKLVATSSVNVHKNPFLLFSPKLVIPDYVGDSDSSYYREEDACAATRVVSIYINVVYVLIQPRD